MSMPGNTATPPVSHDGRTQSHAYDPITQPELFEGVLLRRLAAFVVDFVLIFAPIVLAAMAFAVIGVLTLGLGFMLFWLLGPATVIWALVYAAMTLGGPQSATVGMRMCGLEMRTWYGAPIYGLLACVHMVLFYVSVSAVSPLILLLGLVNSRRRLAHDFLAGTVVINNAERSAALRRYR